MKKYQETENIQQSAEHSGMSYKTASKYVKGGYREERTPRGWRTRKDPFTRIWEEVEERLSGLYSEGATKVDAGLLFNEFLALYPQELNTGMLRSFQRRVKQWKAQHQQQSPPDIYFSQVHRPGRYLELDWFHSKELVVCIGGSPWKHLICHVTLTYSNWEWAVPCESESFASLKETLQSSLFELGKLPLVVKTDNSSTATHSLKRGQSRALNERLQRLLDYYGLGFEKIGIGKPHQNGDIESANGHLRNYLVQCLQLLGHNHFSSVEAYRQWLEQKVRERNQGRQKELSLEKEHMRALVQQRLPDYESSVCKVNKYGMVRIGKGSYSVPRQWHGYDNLESRVFESRVELWIGDKRLARFDTNPNEGGARIHYQHLLPALLKKPGAFENYRYRHEFIPGDIWRSCLDTLQQNDSQRKADKEYLFILGLTLDHPKSAVEKALYQCLAQGSITLDAVKASLGLIRQPQEHPNHVQDADLKDYDLLLATQGGPA